MAFPVGQGGACEEPKRDWSDSLSGEEQRLQESTLLNAGVKWSTGRRASSLSGHRHADHMLCGSQQTRIVAAVARAVTAVAVTARLRHRTTCWSVATFARQRSPSTDRAPCQQLLRQVSSMAGPAQHLLQTRDVRQRHFTRCRGA